MNTGQAVQVLQKGGVLVYPTETLYALGCLACNETACRRVAALKGRPESKPFPLVVADLDGLLALAASLPSELAEALPRLAHAFWPGPLSILVPTRPELPRLVRDEMGYSSIRISPHPTVQILCRTLADQGGQSSRVGSAALIATSANKSGQPATARPEQLDPSLLAEVEAGGGANLLDPPWPGGGEPSTLIRITGPNRAKVLRQGAVSRENLSSILSLEE